MVTAPDRLITDQEVARLYGVDESTAWRWAKAGRIPGPVVRRHKYSRWSENQIQAHIKKMTAAEKKEHAS